MTLTSRFSPLVTAIVFIAMQLAAMPASATERPVIYSVNYPLQYFAQRIAGEYAEVRFPAPAGIDPAFWTPAVADILAYQQADRVLLNGAGYALWVKRVTLPRARQVDTSAAFREYLIEVTKTVTHSHGPGGEHSHTGTATHTWLDPVQAVYQAAAIRDLLSRLGPEHATDFEARYAALEKDLMALDASLSSLADELDGAPLLASHPVYQYLARRYGFNLLSMQWLPGASPGEAAWEILADTLENHPARLMLWDTPPVGAVAKRLRAMGTEPVLYLPAGNVPASGDFITVMQQNVDRLADAIQDRASP